jgi:hypothetical protein
MDSETALTTSRTLCQLCLCLGVLIEAGKFVGKQWAQQPWS